MRTLLAIYPTARKVEDLLKRASREAGCLMGYRVTTFPQVVDGLWREEADPRALTGAVGERLALEQAVARVRESGIELADTAGMRERLLALIRQLKSAALSADDLRDASQSLPAASRERLELYAAVIGEYENLLQKHRVADAHDRERAVLEILHRAEATGRRPRFLDRVERLIVAEIYDMSLLQFMIVAALIRIVGDAELTIQAQPHRVNASRFAELTWNRFVAEESIADMVLPQFVRRGGRSGRLGFVLEHVFTDEYPPAPIDDGTVRVIEAPNAMGEVEEIAREIRRMLEGPKRIALERVAIVARDLGAYAGYLETFFRRYRIPLNLAQEEPLRSATPARVALDILKAAPGGCRREALLSLSNAPYVRIAARQYRNFLVEIGYLDRGTQPLAERIENYRREAAAQMAEAAGEEERGKLVGKLDYIERAGRAWSALAATVEALEGQATVAEHVERLNRALEQLNFDPLAESILDAGARAVGPLMEALATLAREAAQVAPARMITLEDFSALAEGVLLETPATVADRSAAGVRALPLLEARGLDFDLVFVLGLNDGVFPRYYADDPLVPDDLARALNRPLAAAVRRRMGDGAPAAPGPILRTRYDRNAEEPFLFFLALSMPARAVVLSYATSDQRGNPMQRSPFVDEVVRLLGEGDEKIVARARAQDFIPLAKDCFAAAEFINRAVADGILGRPAAVAMADRKQIDSIGRRIAIEQARERYFDLPTREERDGRGEAGAEPAKSARAGDYDGKVGDDPRVARFLMQNGDATARRWSAAQLTELATCAFKYFAHRVLGLREENEPDYEESALEIGDMAHRVLDEIKRRGIDFGNAVAARGASHEVLDAERARRRSGTRDAAFFNLEWDNLVRIIDEMIEYEACRRAEGAPAPEDAMPEREIRFELRDRRAADPRIDLEIEGRVDLLELYRDARAKITRVRTVDYKTSRNRDKYEKLLQAEKFARKDFQMPVYAMGALAEFRGELANKVVVEAAYLVLKSRDKEASARFDAELFTTDPKRRAALAAAGEQPIADRMIELVRAAARGRFDVDPLECADYCPFRRLCRYHKTDSPR
jgi:ATP-dependent helicase/nuclease subunit B